MIDVIEPSWVFNEDPVKAMSLDGLFLLSRAFLLVRRRFFFFFFLLLPRPLTHPPFGSFGAPVDAGPMVHGA